MRFDMQASLRRSASVLSGQDSLVSSIKTPIPASSRPTLCPREDPRPRKHPSRRRVSRTDALPWRGDPFASSDHRVSSASHTGADSHPPARRRARARRCALRDRTRYCFGFGRLRVRRSDRRGPPRARPGSVVASPSPHGTSRTAVPASGPACDSAGSGSLVTTPAVDAAQTRPRREAVVVIQADGGTEK